MMWIGVTSGFAGMKFSGSVRRLGVNKATMIRVARRTINPLMSFVV